MKIILMRHGETNYNVLGLTNSKPTDEVFLTAAGETQARQAAEKLKPEKIEAIYISELLRTAQTAEFINEHHGAPVIVDGRLNDISTGMEGAPNDEYDALKAAAADAFTFKLAGGESSEEVLARVKLFYQDLLNTTHQTVLVVSSEHILLLLLSLIDQDDPVEKLRGSIKNGQLVYRELNVL